MDATVGVLETGATPEAAAAAFAAAVEARDLEAAGALFAPEGLLLTPDGAEARGRAQVRDALAQMAVAQPLVRFQPGRALVAGEMALVSQSWTVSLGGADGGRDEQDLSALLSLVQRPQSWQLLFAAPWGM